MNPRPWQIVTQDPRTDEDDLTYVEVIRQYGSYWESYGNTYSMDTWRMVYGQTGSSQIGIWSWQAPEVADETLGQLDASDNCFADAYTVCTNSNVTGGVVSDAGGTLGFQVNGGFNVGTQEAEGFHFATQATGAVISMDGTQPELANRGATFVIPPGTPVYAHPNWGGGYEWPHDGSEDPY